MKKTAIAIIAILSAAVLAAPAAAARKNDFKVIQAAVKSGAKAETPEVREPRWFKVLIKDHGSDEAALRITLPVALVEVVLASSDCRRFKVDESRGEIDLKAVWAALKKAGPMALVEIEDDGAVIRVWLE